MSGLKGQDRTPRSEVRTRRNFDHLATDPQFIGDGEVIQLVDGVFVVVLKADSGLVNDAGELAVDLATDPALEFSTGMRVKVKADSGIVRDADGLSVLVDSSSLITLGASGIGFDLDELYRQFEAWDMI